MSPWRSHRHIRWRALDGGGCNHPRTTKEAAAEVQTEGKTSEKPCSLFSKELAVDSWLFLTFLEHSIENLRFCSFSLHSRVHKDAYSASLQQKRPPRRVAFCTHISLSIWWQRSRLPALDPYPLFCWKTHPISLAKSCQC